MIPLWISIAGGFGAVVRFTTDGLIRTVLGRNFPWATLIINVVGSFILGILTRLVLKGYADLNIKLIVGIGFCGGFTTFSTASFEAVRLLEEKRYVVALLQIISSVGLSVLAAFCGFWLVVN